MLSKEQKQLRQYFTIWDCGKNHVGNHTYQYECLHGICGTPPIMSIREALDHLKRYHWEKINAE